MGAGPVMGPALARVHGTSGSGNHSQVEQGKKRTSSHGTSRRLIFVINMISTLSLVTVH